MNTMSYYEVECLCGEKARTTTKSGVAHCHKCGRDIHLDGWQVARTQTASGLIIKHKPGETVEDPKQ